MEILILKYLNRKDLEIIEILQTLRLVIFHSIAFNSYKKELVVIIEVHL